MKIYAQTDRWLMRDLLPEDAEEMFALESDADVHRYLGNTPITSMSDIRQIIAGVQRQCAKYRIGRWAVIERGSGAFVGWSGLKYEVRMRKGVAYYDLGFRLRPAYWGKGFASETGRAAIRYGFEVMRLNEICASALPANVGSNRALCKAGMQPSGKIEAFGLSWNWYKLTEDDWRKDRD